MRKRFLFAALLLVAAIMAAVFWRGGVQEEKSSYTKPAEQGSNAGKLAQTFSLSDLEGRAVTIPQTGKITVLNFWATWCPPCREEMPELQAFAGGLPQNVVFYAVNIQEPSAKIRTFLGQNGYSMPVLSDGDGLVAANYRINSIPTTMIFDRQGTVKYRKSGGVTQAELVSVIKGLGER